MNIKAGKEYKKYDLLVNFTKNKCQGRPMINHPIIDISK